MSDENETPAPEADSETRIKNIQAETQRKMENLRSEFSESNQKMEQTLQTILQNIQGRQAVGKDTAAQEKKLSELIYDDPEAAVSAIEDRVTRKVLGASKAESSFNSAAAQLESDYPEFRDRNSEQFKRVQTYYNQLPQEMIGTKQGLENAALRAAADFGLVTSARRKGSSNEDFSVSSGGTSSGRKASSKASGEMAADQAAFAQLLNAPVDNPKFKEIFKKASKRSEWNKYKGNED